MAPSANVVTKDGWSHVSYGWTCSHCGLERLWFSSKQCRRCGAPKPSGSSRSPDAAAPAPRQNRKRGARPAPKQATTPEVSLAKAFDVLKSHERLQDSQALALVQQEMEQAVEADKLAKRQARTPEVAMQSSLSAINSRRAALAKAQAKVSELEEAAKKANEAVDEAKQKAEKLQGEIDKLQKEYDQDLARLTKHADPVTHLQNNVREAFQVVSDKPEAQPFIAPMETALAGLSGLLAIATPTPMATDVGDDKDLQMGDASELSSDAIAAARTYQRSLEGLPEEEREAKKAKFAELTAPRQV